MISSVIRCDVEHKWMFALLMFELMLNVQQNLEKNIGKSLEFAKNLSISTL